jgi:deoxyribose-phosphate aldolase
VDPRLQQLDVEKLLDRVAAEIERRLARGPGATFPKFPVTVGAPFCAACTTKGHCAKVCPDGAENVAAHGADRIGATPGIGSIERKIAAAIDHTLLKPEATKDEVTYLCAEAAKYVFASVCINPYWVPLCARLLKGHPVAVCTVVGFPLGANTSELKAAEARKAIEDGATEIDMVLNVGALKSGLIAEVESDIRAVREATRGVILKVILETALLNDEQKIAACEASKRAGADFVKTSTGFSTGGATAADVALMRRVVGPDMGVKASGGVRTKKDATLMLNAGATRIGASASVKIMQELPSLGGGAAKAPAASGGY